MQPQAKKDLGWQELEEAGRSCMDAPQGTPRPVDTSYLNFDPWNC